MSDDFDAGCRYLAKLDAPAFVAWATRLPADQYRFRAWIDARRVRFPGEGGRTCDTVAWLDEVATGAPWAWPIEFQYAPDFDMFGRMLVYLAGQGSGSRVMACQANGAHVELTMIERNLATESAADTLAAIVAGTVPESVLALIPLMKDGGEDAIIQAWLQRAGAIKDDRRRRDLGGLAQVFSHPAGCRDVWRKALEGWNMIRSVVVDEWRAEALAESSIEVLNARFGALPEELTSAIGSIKDLDRQRLFARQAALCTSLDDFRQKTGL